MTSYKEISSDIRSSFLVRESFFIADSSFEAILLFSQLHKAAVSCGGFAFVNFAPRLSPTETPFNISSYPRIQAVSAASQNIYEIHYFCFILNALLLILLVSKPFLPLSRFWRSRLF